MDCRCRLLIEELIFCRLSCGYIRPPIEQNTFRHILDELSDWECSTEKCSFNASTGASRRSGKIENEPKSDEESEGRICELIAWDSGSIEKAGTTLADWLKYASSITLIDPYFFDFKISKNSVFKTEPEYLDFIAQLFQGPDLKFVRIVFEKGSKDGLKGKICEKISREGKVRIQLAQTSEFHDRFIVKNKQESKLVGTSFNGMGRKKVYSILDLPVEDHNRLMEIVGELDFTPFWI